MKKVIAMVVCVAMLACFALTASAATKATFTIATVDAKAVGETVIVNMDIAEAKTMIGAVGFKFAYDADYLKFVEHPESYEFFTTGAGAGSLLAVGNEANMEVQMAGDGGMKAPGTVLALAFEIIKEIPAGETAVVSGEFTLQPSHAEKADETYEATIVNGGVKAAAPVVVPPVDGGEDDDKDPVKPQDKPVVDKPVVDEPVEDVTVTDTEANPETGDVSGIAVAAGLCAVMAAAFVITKKVND